MQQAREGDDDGIGGTDAKHPKPGGTKDRRHGPPLPPNKDPPDA